eukprot:CAMPEP_0168378112 /NCGR_PEP_ID=MMETSP0228-20121227/11171_1 /TAXON_ID=133427 /ORGANISM="Protoceratium reticulatum, Strain CCCM 535 (=CCMP 1889)" /LENGTH=218 /DNA_ID=CAMNT_0008391125 /DNA_START=1 /DNA_END=657 /DNA_ORIENTATION=-
MAMRAALLLAGSGALAALSPEHERAACCYLHDNCQYLYEDMPDPVPRECKVGNKFTSAGVKFTILGAEIMDTDTNSYNVSSGNQSFSCDLYDYGEWLVHDPLDFAKDLRCPGGPTGEQKRAACCVIHNSCQYLSPGIKDLPEGCKKGHRFDAFGVPFRIVTASYLDTDENSYTLAGETGAPFDCDCFEYNGWFCSDPTFTRGVLTCSPAAPEAVPVVV